MHYCTGHMEEMGTAIKRHGLWRYVDSRPTAIKGFAARWLLGRAMKDEIDPLVVLMLEIGAKAVRMGLRQDSKRCPLCAIAYISEDSNQPMIQIKEYMERIIRPLMITNGRKPGGPGRRLIVGAG